MGEGGGVSSRFSFYFLPIENQGMFFSQSESQNIFFRTKQKQNIFSKQHICSKCILIDLYVRVCLEPNIHIYMGILFICSCISWILGPSVYVHIKILISAI